MGQCLWKLDLLVVCAKSQQIQTSSFTSPWRQPAIKPRLSLTASATCGKQFVPSSVQFLGSFQAGARNQSLFTGNESQYPGSLAFPFRKRFQKTRQETNLYGERERERKRRGESEKKESSRITGFFRREKNEEGTPKKGILLLEM